MFKHFVFALVLVVLLALGTFSAPTAEAQGPTGGTPSPTATTTPDVPYWQNAPEVQLSEGATVNIPLTKVGTAKNEPHPWTCNSASFAKNWGVFKFTVKERSFVRVVMQGNYVYCLSLWIGADDKSGFHFVEVGTEDYYRPEFTERLDPGQYVVTVFTDVDHEIPADVFAITVTPETDAAVNAIETTMITYMSHGNAYLDAQDPELPQLANALKPLLKEEKVNVTKELVPTDLSKEQLDDLATLLLQRIKIPNVSNEMLADETFRQMREDVETLKRSAAAPIQVTLTADNFDQMLDACLKTSTCADKFSSRVNTINQKQLEAQKPNPLEAAWNILQGIGSLLGWVVAIFIGYIALRKNAAKK